MLPSKRQGVVIRCTAPQRLMMRFVTSAPQRAIVCIQLLAHVAVLLVPSLGPKNLYVRLPTFVQRFARAPAYHRQRCH